MTEMIEPVPAQIDQQRLAQDIVEQARAEGLQLVGEDGLLTGLTKSVLEAGLEAEMSEHIGYDKHDPIGRNGGNSRNGTRTKSVLTAVGPVTIEVPRDRDGTFEPVIVRKRSDGSSSYATSVQPPPTVSSTPGLLTRRCQYRAVQSRRRAGTGRREVHGRRQLERILARDGGGGFAPKRLAASAPVGSTVAWSHSWSEL